MYLPWTSALKMLHFNAGWTEIKIRWHYNVNTLKSTCNVSYFTNSQEKLQRQTFEWYSNRLLFVILLKSSEFSIFICHCIYSFWYLSTLYFKNMLTSVSISISILYLKFNCNDMVVGYCFYWNYCENFMWTHSKWNEFILFFPAHEYVSIEIQQWKYNYLEKWKLYSQTFKWSWDNGTIFGHSVFFHCSFYKGCIAFLQNNEFHPIFNKRQCSQCAVFFLIC